MTRERQYPMLTEALDVLSQYLTPMSAARLGIDEDILRRMVYLELALEVDWNGERRYVITARGVDAL